MTTILELVKRLRAKRKLLRKLCDIDREIRHLTLQLRLADSNPPKSEPLQTRGK